MSKSSYGVQYEHNRLVAQIGQITHSITVAVYRKDVNKGNVPAHAMYVFQPENHIILTWQEIIPWYQSR